MEQQYLIGVTNKFAAFIDESEDPYDIIKNVEAEKLKKKALKVTVSNENKENKAKDDQKNKAAPRKAAGKTGDRVLAPDRGVKSDNAPERANNRRNREDTGNNEFPRFSNFRDGNKNEGGAPRGPRSDAPKGDKREGPRRDGEGRTFRGDGESRPFRGPRQEGETRPFRQDRDRQQGSDGEGRPPRRERREFTSDGPEQENRPERRPGGGRGRGGRPPGPGRNYDNRGKREFDRKSGSDRTGVKAVDKRDGAGPYNWDSTKDVDALACPDLNVTNLSDEADWDEAAKDGEAAPDLQTKLETDETTEEVPAAVEEEPKELTLDEYRALRGKREKPQYDIRKPGEGEDLTQWKNMVEIKKKDADADPDCEDEEEIADFPQRAGRQRHVVGIDITFKDTFRGGRGRGRAPGVGGRGRPRDGLRESRGEPRDQQQRRFQNDRFRDDRRDDRGSRQSAPKVDDEKAFPSLG